MSQQDELRRYVAEAELRALPDDEIDWITPAPRPPDQRSEALAAIDLAASRSTIGNLPEGTRLPGVKRGALRALRLITIDQNAFNIAVVAALESLEAAQDGGLHELRTTLAQAAVTAASLDTETERLTERLDTETERLDTETERLDTETERLDTETERLDTETERLTEAQSKAAESHRQLVELVHEISHTLGMMGDRLESGGVDLTKLRSVVAELGRQTDRQQESLRFHDDRLTVLLREARRRLPETLDEQQLRTFSDQLERRFDALYTEFENRYRGSRDAILTKLSEYFDLLDLEAAGELGPVVDLGSGRGEWLELLDRNGVSAYGIDVNADIGAAAQRRGLDVRVEDGLEHLRELDAGSVGMVSMFHIAEHLDFETLFDVMRAALRALAPGGVLLIETPNPSNLTVGASSFYLDPTHVAPVHPQLVEFLAMAAGFTDATIHYLHLPTEPQFALPDDLRTEDELQRILEHLNWALLGPLDYALIARKSSEQEA